MEQVWSRRKVLHGLGGTATVSTIGSVERRKNDDGEAKVDFPVSQRLGSTHVAANYTFTDHNVLNEGAKQLQQLGTEVVKIWFHYLDKKYSQHSGWPSSFSTLVDQAKHDYLQELFDRPFKTFILSTYSKQPGNYNHYFRDGVSTAEYQQEVDEFYELSKYLLETYQGTGKEFILQHWQGDWESFLMNNAIRSGATPSDPMTLSQPRPPSTGWFGG